MTVHQAVLATPLGDLIATADDGAITELRFSEPGELPDEPSSTACLEQIAEILERYWAGEPVRFDVPLQLNGTPFQTKVWRALIEVPYGETTTYSEIARRIGAPRAVRAVGRANGANPIAIAVPCHRVIGANGTLTGYGGGIERKKALLELEGALGS
jgi:methylated-DNA-[protein]-cysteine S-methyltransferase